VPPNRFFPCNIGTAGFDASGPKGRHRAKPDERTEDAQRPQVNPRREEGAPEPLLSLQYRDGGIRRVRPEGPASGEAR